MESLELPVSLENIIKTKEVTVVQAIDVEALTAALQWCVSKLQAQPTPDLAKENEQLRSQIKGLEEKQVSCGLQQKAPTCHLPAYEPGVSGPLS
jgi:hypothetical protein